MRAPMLCCAVLCVCVCVWRARSAPSECTTSGFGVRNYGNDRLSHRSENSRTPLGALGARVRTLTSMTYRTTEEVGLRWLPIQRQWRIRRHCGAVWVDQHTEDVYVCNYITIVGYLLCVCVCVSLDR